MTETINWAQMMEESKDAFAPIPVGKYECEVTKAEATRSSTDKLMYKVTFQVVEGPKAGSTLFTNVTLTPGNPRAVFMFFENLKALGITEAFLKQSPPPPPEMVASKMVGARVLVDVDHRPYQGVVRENVKGYTRSARAGGGVGAVPTVPGAPAPSVPSGVPSPTPAVTPPPAAPTPPMPTAVVDGDAADDDAPKPTF